ncbi:MAG: hypothetical protein RIT26_1816 [Pseudomonadota bacterium]|jgi:hypothetical protein
MMPSINPSSSKVTRSRERMRAAGLRPVQFWVPDTRLKAFAADVRSQCQAIKGDAHEDDAIRFAEEAAERVKGWA